MPVALMAREQIRHYHWPLWVCCGLLCARAVPTTLSTASRRMAEPYCLAMVLCDGVHRDFTTGKYTILGTFSTLGAYAFPAKISFCIYFAITDGLGPTRLRLRLVDAESGIVDKGENVTEGLVFEIETDLAFEDPLAVVETVVAIRTALPRAGLYHCELWAGDDMLMSRRLLAVQKTSGETEEVKSDE